MKKSIFIMILVFVLLLFSGCQYLAYKSDYSNIENYDEIWDLSGFRHGYDDEMFFPSDLNNYEVIKYYCRYDQQLPLGEGIQVYLEIQFRDNVSIKTEIERFSKFAIKCDGFFEETGFEAYVTRLGEDIGICEYALVDYQNKKMYYVFLQCLPKNEIQFSHALLPKGYSGYGDITGLEDGMTSNKTGDGSLS